MQDIKPHPTDPRCPGITLPSTTRAEVELMYCALADVGEMLAKGWQISNDMADTHHGFYGVLMVREVKSEEGCENV